MKKLICFITAIILVFGFAACSEQSRPYRPQYGEKLILSEDLQLKEDCRTALTDEQRQLLGRYLEKMMDFYNSVDPRKRQDPFFSRDAYEHTDSFLTLLDIASAKVMSKLENGQRLDDKEQQFVDITDAVCAIPIKLAQIDSRAYDKAEEESGGEVTSVTLDRREWEELFDLYVTACDMLYQRPFAAP